MFRLLSLTTLVLTLGLLVGCGGGANDDPPGAVTLFGSPDSASVNSEMVTNLEPVTLTATVSLNGNLNDVDSTAGTVRVDRYRIVYTRRGGGVGLDPVEGSISQTVSIGGSFPRSATFDMVIMSTNQKVYSAFAQDFANSNQPATFDCQVTLYGQSLAGENKTASFGFILETGVYGSTAGLVPDIRYMFQTVGIIYPGDYVASWLVEGQVDSGVFLLPWGDWYVLPGNANFFPLGRIAVSTSVLDLAPGFSYEGDSGVLYVSNRYGSTQFSHSDRVTVTALPDTIPDPPDAVNILQFYPTRTTINRGESVTLNYVLTGDVDKLEMMPSSFNGVPVQFSGDLTFGSVTITPTETVRPLLRASNAVSEDTAFLSETITVVDVVDPTAPPVIDFFRVDRTSVNLGRSVVFYWNVSGAVSKVELFPFNGRIFDVTNLNSLVSPPFTETGLVTFSLVVFGVDGSVVRQDLTVSVALAVNQNVTITNVNAQPGSSIDNEDQASFSFTVTDPERHDCSWKVTKIAGDGASFFPRDGKIPNGLGPGVVSLVDFQDNQSGFLTFLIEAWDDAVFGGSGAATKAVQLVNFTTSGVLSDTAPVIDSFDFTPSGPATSPGSQGSLAFSFHDPDTLSLRWSLQIVAGDDDGTFSSRFGDVETGQGQIQSTYNDDPDTLTDPVVFMLKVEEVGTGNPQSAIRTIRVDKGAGAVSGGSTPNGENIAFPLSALYANFTGTPDSSQLMNARRIYFNGNLADPHFYQNSDLSGEVTGLSFVVDMIHESNNPGAIVNPPTYARNFQNPDGGLNNGDMTFVNYFPSSGALTGGTPTPTNGYVARYRMTFTIEAFRNVALNLPTTGSRTYSLTVTATDGTENAALPTDITVTVP